MAARRRPPAPVLALLVATAVVAAQALLVALFAGVGSNAEPRDLPIVVAGPAPAVAGFTETLNQAEPDGFEITRVADAAAAEQALRDREAYGAFVLGPGPDDITVRTVSAASPAIAQLLGQVATRAGAEPPTPDDDVVPASADDPRGAGFAAGFLPLALTSMLAGIALVVAVSGRWARLLGLGLYAVLAGLVVAAMLGWLGVLEGGYLAGAAVLGLIALAAAGGVAGLGALLGTAGIGLGAALVFLVGNPLSAVTSAPELLPQPWGEVGQWLPPGAGGTLLRSVVWFDGAGSAQALWVLAGWAVVGAALLLVGRARVAVANQAHATAE